MHIFKDNPAYHVWAEVMIPGYGWIPVDSSISQSALQCENAYSAQQAPCIDYFFRNQDPFRYYIQHDEDVPVVPDPGNIPYCHAFQQFPVVDGNTSMTSMDYYPEPDCGHPKRRMRIFFPGMKMISLLLLIAIPVMGIQSGDITMNHIENTDYSRPFTVTGTVSNPDCSWIGIEIFPQDYWDQADRIVRYRDSKGFRLSLRFVLQNINDIETTSNDVQYDGVFLYLYNPDGTIAYLPAPPCPDHRLHFSRVGDHLSDNRSWSSTFNGNSDRKELHRGKYVILAWDATDQSIYQNTHVENIYDVKNKTIYPTTKKGPIWDSENRKDLVTKVIQVR